MAPISREDIYLICIVIIDLACWWEARQANSVMKLYFHERKRWYAARAKNKKEDEKSEGKADGKDKTIPASEIPAGPIPLNGTDVAGNLGLSEGIMRGVQKTDEKA